MKKFFNEYLNFANRLADEAGIITKIFENALPFSTTSIFGGYDVQYVLEINAGLTKSLGIKTGGLIKHSLVLPRD